MDGILAFLVRTDPDYRNEIFPNGLHGPVLSEASTYIPALKRRELSITERSDGLAFSP